MPLLQRKAAPLVAATPATPPVEPKEPKGRRKLTITVSDQTEALIDLVRKRWNLHTTSQVFDFCVANVARRIPPEPEEEE